MRRECRHGRLNKLRRGGSADGPVGEHDLELAENQVPVLAPGMPVLDNPLRGQIEHPAQGIVVGKAGLVESVK